MKLKVVSGGQTGADLAGLWAAAMFGIPTGGIAPANFKTLIGERPTLGSLFHLEARGDYRSRTIENVKSSDLTIIFASNIFSPGTKLTLKACRENNVPHLLITFNATDLDSALVSGVTRIVTELNKQATLDRQFVINIAGNSSRNSIKVFPFTFRVLCAVFETLLGESKMISSVGVDKLEAILRDRFEIDDGMAKLLAS